MDRKGRSERMQARSASRTDCSPQTTIKYSSNENISIIVFVILKRAFQVRRKCTVFVQNRNFKSGLVLHE